MDPFTFGMVAVGASGGALCLLSLFDKHINQTAVKISLEVTKYGGLLWLLNHISKAFMFWF